MALTLDALCGGMELTHEQITETRASQEDVERLRKRHLDTRYAKTLGPINDVFGLMDLSRTRLFFSIEYLIELADIMQEYTGPHRKVIDVNLSSEQKDSLRQIPIDFTYDHQRQIELMDSKMQHDLAATTDWLKIQLLTRPELGLQEYAEAVHFCLTSENVNGFWFASANKRVAEQFLIPTIIEFQETLLGLGAKYLEMPTVALTHGQAAEYTTLGKEYFNIADALDISLRELIVNFGTGNEEPFKFTSSIRGAVGNLNDHYAAYPNIDWRVKLDSFLERLGVEPKDMSDQCVSFLRYQQFGNLIAEATTTIEKAGEDFWGKIQDQMYSKLTKAGEKGSSVMAQKANPWLVEGGLAILKKGVIQLQTSFNELRRYHFQGDMSRSILTRDVGDDYGKIVLGVRRIMAEMKKYVPNETRMTEYIDQNPGVATAPIMSTLKAIGIEGDIYREMKDLSKTHGENRAVYRTGVEQLCERHGLNVEDKGRILDLLEPMNCVGEAVNMSKDSLVRCRQTIADVRKLYNLTN